MRNESIILATILTLLSVNTNAARNTRGARIITPRTTTNVNVTGTTTTISATIADTTAGKTDYDKIAPITDKQAERECTNLVVQALKKQCTGANKCKNATETYASLSFKDDMLDSTTNISIPSAYRETYCANFLETAVNKLWNSYDSVATLNEENCNIALAKAFAAEDCYLYVMTNQAEKVIIKEDDLKSRCGAEGITNQYNALTGENKADGSIGDDKLAQYFSKVGNIGVSDLMAYPARVLDLKIDFKSSSFPRELVQLVNTIKSQGNVMCGPDRYTELYDTNMPLEIKQTSLQKAVQEKGILKGTSDFVIDQIGVFAGENWADRAKEQGVKALPEKDSTEKTPKKDKNKKSAYEKAEEKCIEECSKYPSPSTEYTKCTRECIEKYEPVYSEETEE